MVHVGPGRHPKLKENLKVRKFRNGAFASFCKLPICCSGGRYVIADLSTCTITGVTTLAMTTVITSGIAVTSPLPPLLALLPPLLLPLLLLFAVLSLVLSQILS